MKWLFIIIAQSPYIGYLLAQTGPLRDLGEVLLALYIIGVTLIARSIFRRHRDDP